MIQRHWYNPSLTWLTCLLLPLSYLFRLVVLIRRSLYKLGIVSAYRSKHPVVVVGNLTVGGTGKTPLVIYLAQALKAKGFKPAIVMRGYGGLTKSTVLVDEKSTPAMVGDEALVLFRRLGCAVVVGRNRKHALKYLEEHCVCDVIISDDGLQHYAIRRDLEILVIDGMRRLGNQQMLPAGPLREPIKRLASVDWVVANGSPQPSELAMHIEPLEFVSLKDEILRKAPEAFNGTKVHAVAGIGNPDRFFNTLTLLGCDIEPHAFKDHHVFAKGDIDFDEPVIMTEKDAVKCLSFAKDNHWYLRVNAHVDPSLIHNIILLIEENKK